MMSDWPWWVNWPLLTVILAVAYVLKAWMNTGGRK